jgi:ABC-type Fe3+/spermidine/putrescine transport system ATPase subunit
VVQKYQNKTFIFNTLYLLVLQQVILKAQNIVKKYPKHPVAVIDDISLSLNKGEILGLVGESGSGKTTLLKILAGMEDRDSGEVIFQEKQLPNPSEILMPGHAEIKMVFQDFKLFPNHKISENIAYPLRRYDKAYQQQRTYELLDKCKLGNIAHKYPRELSGGQKQRVALAVALADEPEILIMDEPFTALDMIHKKILKEVLQDMMEAFEITTILVSHDLQDVMPLCDKIAVMQSGKIEQLDTPQNIYEQPKNPYIAHLFGNANILSGEILQKIEAQLSPNTQVCVRYEAIFPCNQTEQHLEGNIIQSDYMGTHWQLAVQTQHNEVLYLNTPQNHFQKGEHIYLRIDLTKLFVFNAHANIL